MRRVRILISFVLLFFFYGLEAQIVAWIDPPDDTLFICQDNNINLTGFFNGGIPPYTFFWTGHISFLDNPSAQTVLFTGSVPGTYTLWFNVIDGNNNHARDSIVIVVKPKPILSISGPTIICQGQNATLTATGATTYFWFNEGGMLIGVGTPFNVSPNTTTMYTLVGVKNGCANSTNHTINVVQPPTANAGPSVQICLGQNYTLTGSSASNYDSIYWTTSGDGYFSNPNALHPTYYPGANDNAGGSVTLTLIAYGKSPCNQVTSSMTLTIQLPQPVQISGDTVLCEGDHGTISASPGSTFTWCTGENGSSIQVNTAGWYSVTAVLGACTTVDSVMVVVKPRPNVQVSGSNNICFGDTAWLQAGGANTYLWNTGDTTLMIYVAPLSTTTYVVTGVSNGCTSSASLQVNVHQPPVLTVTSDTSICAGSSAMLSAGGAEHYLWSTGDTSSIIVVSPSTTTTYYLTAFDAYCQVNDSILVNIIPLPEVELGNDTILCPGDGLLLNAGLADSYQWNTGDTTPYIFVFPGGPVTFTVTVTKQGCSQTDSIHLDIKDLPPVYVSNDTSICQSSTITLSVTGGDHYQWSTGDTTASIQVMPTQSTLYVVQVFVDGCTVWKSVMVQVQNLPDFTLSGPTSICEGQSATLVAQGASSYQWSTGETTSSINVTPGVTTTYHVTALEGLCHLHDSITVNVYPIPQVNLGNDTVICPGTVAALTAGISGSYHWNTGDTTSVLQVTPQSLTYYEVTVTVNGCSNADGIWVDVLTLPPVQVSPDTGVCQGSQVTLAASGGDTYLWSNGENTSSINVTPGQSTQYVVTVINGVCVRKDSVYVEVYPLPSVSDENLVLCEGSSTWLDPGVWNSYLWSNGSVLPSLHVTPGSDTTIWVKVTNQWGCEKIKYYHISLQAKPILTLQDEYHVCEGNTVSICVHGADQYFWSNGMNDSCIVFTTATNVTLYVLGVKGVCSVIDSLNVYVHQNVSVSVPSTILMLQGDTVTVDAQISSDTDYVVLWQPTEGVVYSNDSTLQASPDSTTTYYVIVQNVWGCAGVDSVTVVVYPPGIYANMMGDTVVCSGDSITLWVDVFLAPTNDLHYQWYPSLGLSSDTVAKPKLFPSVSQMYYVSITDEEGHVFYDSVYVEVIKTPHVYLGNDTAVCEGTVLTFMDNNPGKHVWFNGDSTNVITIVMFDDTIITLEVNNQGCRDRDSVFVEVIRVPHINPGPDRVICQGDSVPIPVISSFEAFGNIKETGILYISPLQDTIIYYEAESHGCKTSDTLHIKVNPVPVFTLQVSSETYIEGQPILLEVLPSTFEKYYFFLNDQLQVINHSGSHYYDMLQTGDFLRVIVENEFGCRSEKIWEGKLRDIPNVFTPNGNGMNDRFMKGVFVKIFNRWGQLIYEGSDGWDGTFQGEPVYEGTYYYVIEFINPELGTHRVYSGSILLIR